jgi:aspartyl/asparaginyl-tRNA synthetase
MMTAAELQPTPAFQSAMFLAPGRPRPLARRLAIHNRVIRAIRDFFFEAGFNEVPVTALADHLARVQLEGMIARGFTAVWCESEILPAGGVAAALHEPKHLRGFKLIEASHQGLDLDALCGLAGRLLRAVAGDMSADLLGGVHVTRLDRMINAAHQRLTYREALAVLATKGWQVPFGEPLPEQAKATLTRHCGNLPFLLTHLPVGLKLPGAAPTPGAPDVCESFHYILPYAGLTFDGSVRSATADPAGFSLDLGRLLQYLMGLENIIDTLIDPMDKVVGIMRNVPAGTGLGRTGGAG